SIVKRETQFTSQHSANEIVLKIEEAAKPLGFKVQKQNYKESGDVMRNIPGHLSDDLTMNNIKGKCDESEDDSSVNAKSDVDMKECVQHQDDHNIESGRRENSKLDMNGKHFEDKAVNFSGKTSSAMHVPYLRSLNGDSEKQQMPVVTCNSMVPQVPHVVGDTTLGTPTKASRSLGDSISNIAKVSKFAG
ncbi:hypothetical protein GIB67_028455, partial [Kingdonia uniflora]